mmetsp:Transcript_49378/g.72176  ORF Transcript_49378/g.72176 Transcript_49378/m.72176 type:complete len:462 (-) Transcript_49378:308-1693(-)
MQQFIVLLRRKLCNRHQQRRYQVAPDLLDGLHGRLVPRVHHVHRELGVDGLHGPRGQPQAQQRRQQRRRLLANCMLCQAQGDHQKCGGGQAGQRDFLVLFRAVHIAANENTPKQDSSLEAGASQVDLQLLGDAPTGQNLFNEGPNDVGDTDGANEGSQRPCEAICPEKLLNRLEEGGFLLPGEFLLDLAGGGGHGRLVLELGQGACGDGGAQHRDEAEVALQAQGVRHHGAAHQEGRGNANLVEVQGHCRAGGSLLGGEPGGAEHGGRALEEGLRRAHQHRARHHQRVPYGAGPGEEAQAATQPAAHGHEHAGPLDGALQTDPGHHVRDQERGGHVCEQEDVDQRGGRVREDALVGTWGGGHGEADPVREQRQRGEVPQLHPPLGEHLGLHRVALSVQQRARCRCRRLSIFIGAKERCHRFPAAPTGSEAAHAVRQQLLHILCLEAPRRGAWTKDHHALSG